MKSVLKIMFLLVISWQAKAVIETYEFDNKQQEALYTEIVHELRCPKCQNQTIAESNAGLSKDLRYIVYQKVTQNESKETILAYMQKRYGDFVLYDPPVKPSNYILWFSPLLILLMVIIIVLAKVGRRKVTSEDDL